MDWMEERFSDAPAFNSLAELPTTSERAKLVMSPDPIKVIALESAVAS
jgi:hypothetical protein